MRIFSDPEGSLLNGYPRNCRRLPNFFLSFLEVHVLYVSFYVTFVCVILSRYALFLSLNLSQSLSISLSLSFFLSFSISCFSFACSAHSFACKSKSEVLFQAACLSLVKSPTEPKGRSGMAYCCLSQVCEPKLTKS